MVMDASLRGFLLTVSLNSSVLRLATGSPNRDSAERFAPLGISVAETPSAIVENERHGRIGTIT
jgi:hypothetical protein